MKFSNDTNYIINFESQGILDLAMGIEDVSKENVIRCGLGSHCVSFQPEEILEDSDDKMKFTIANGETISLKIIDAVDYKKLRGILFSQNCPEITDDSEVQEYINSMRSY